MSYQAVSTVLAHSQAKGSDRLVLVVLASHASEETFECYPGRDLLCKEAAMSERNLIYCLKKLEETGELTVSRGNGRGNLTTYRITLRQAEEAERVQHIAPFIPQERVQNPVQKVKAAAPITTEKGCNLASERVQDSVERVQPTVIKGAKSGSAYKDIEPSWNQEETKEELIPIAVAPGSITSKECYALFVELRSSVGEYEAPYQNQTADFVHLNKLFKNCERTNWPLTRDKFTQAALHYFATPQKVHTLADLATRFSEFYKSAFDKFGKPTANGNGVLAELSPEGRASVAAAQAWLKQKQEERERTGRI